VRPIPLAVAALALLAVALPVAANGAAVQRRAHATHGTVRKLCEPARVRKWPHGPSVGRVAAGKDLRRYHFDGAWALGVTTKRPVLRGWVLVDAFCRPSARGRRAALIARELAAHPPAGRPGTPLAKPRLRRVCAPLIYVRDRPLNRAIGLLYVGDTLSVTRRARNPWLGGVANGHVKRRGWIPRSALCHDMDKRAAGHAPAAGPTGHTVLAPPAVVRCGALVSGGRMLQVGLLGTDDVGAELHDHAGRLVSSARFTRGRGGRWSYAAAGPYRCGQRYAVVYESGDQRVRFALRVAARRAPKRDGTAAASSFGLGARASSATRAGAVGPAAAVVHAAPAPRVASAVRRVGATSLRRAAPSCASKPQKKFAHGGNGPVDHRFHARPAISADGRYVAFDLPAAGIVPADRNGVRDVFVRDAAGGRTKLVSVARGGGVGNATSRAASISAGGRLVAFESSASDLVAGDDDGVRDVFVRDVRAGTTRRIAPGRSPALSADGRFVAFEGAGGVVVADLGAGTRRRVVTAAYRPALSADGRYVAFETRRAISNRDANHNWDVYRLDRTSGATVLLSAGPDGPSRGGQSLSAVLSADGSVAAFQSDAPLTRNDRSGLRDVFVRDVAKRRTTLVSASRCGRPSNGYNRYPSISADGRLVAFDSHATDIVAGAPRGRGQVYLRDVARGRTRLISATGDGRPSSRTSFSPAIAGRATIVAFPSFAYDLGPKDANHRVDIYRRNVVRAVTNRVS
jgi:Tol biopolymer transport system component